MLAAIPYLQPVRTFPRRKFPFASYPKTIQHGTANKELLTRSERFSRNHFKRNFNTLPFVYPITNLVRIMELLACSDDAKRDRNVRNAYFNRHNRWLKRLLKLSLINFSKVFAIVLTLILDWLSAGGMGPSVIGWLGMPIIYYFNMIFIQITKVDFSPCSKCAVSKMLL